MARRYRNWELHEDVLAVMKETGHDDPFDAVKCKARAVAQQFHATFGAEPPFDVMALASLRGLHLSDEDPRFSEDSEIAADADGRIVLRINQDRPERRRRFSVCHEVGHTLFPDYQEEVRCRRGAGAGYVAPDDLLETLCDVAAAELMFPDPWFEKSVEETPIAADALAALADQYQASREATIRRFVERHREPLAAVFLSWKFKPTEERRLKARSQTIAMFEDLELQEPERALRVDYSVSNEAFENAGGPYIPQDKSTPSKGVIYEASTQLKARDGRQALDFGRTRCAFRVHALPIYTAQDFIGPDGASSVVAVLCPE